MEQITFNPNNEPYYSEDFIKGFKCGAQRQFEADKADRPQGEWELECDGEGECDNLYRCPFCGNRVGCEAYDKPKFCDECGADLKGADDE